MHLSMRQLDRFFDLLDSLLVFANRHLSLVSELSLPIVGEEAEMKAAFVCEMLWANREVIDEYVRANPDGLPARDLRAVAAWKDALAADFTLVEHREGRALMMHETGLYAVCGLDRDLSERLPQTPDILHAVLLPFEGLIVTDGLEMGSGYPLNEDELQQMRVEYAQAEERGVATTADALVERAAAYNRQLRELDFDALLASVEREARQSREGERLPEGYHRGVLAGMDEQARARAVEEHVLSIGMRTAGGEAPIAPMRDASPAGEPVGTARTAANPSTSMGDASSVVKPVPADAASSRDAEPAAPAATAAGAVLPSPGAAAESDSAVGAASSTDDAATDAGEAPYAPPWLEGADPARIVYERERDEIVLNCADALSQMCGLMTLNEAYEAYCAAVLDVVPLERFVAVLMEEDADDSAEFALQEWQGQSYLMHFSVSDGYARDWVAHEKARSLVAEGTTVSTEAEATALLARVANEISSRLQGELESLDAYRAHLLDCHRRTGRRPLYPEAAEGAYLEALASKPAMLQLRAFLDAHVPDGEDDFTYADRVLDEVILHSIDSGDAPGFLDEVERGGALACTEDPELFLRLLENAYGALPSWEFNGWSPQEVMEKMMGRRIFYNVRGEMMHPALEDACPCGSGKPYGQCHGV